MIPEENRAQGAGTTDEDRRAQLRRRAEERAQERSAGVEDFSREAVLALIHELRVHQIELELQNEELRRAQEELAASRDRYSDLYDFAPVGYFTLDERGAIREVNLAGAALLGVDRGALTGGSLLGFVAQPDRGRYATQRRRLTETGRPLSLDIRLVRGDGSEFYARLEGTVAWGSAAGAGYSRLAMSDITARVHAEEALRKSEEQKYRELADSIADPFFALDKDLRVVHWNKASEATTGIPASSIIGRYLFAVFPEIRPIPLERALKQALATDQAQFLETSWDQQDKVIYYTVSVYPIWNGISVFLKDITQRVEAEAKLRSQVRILAAVEERQRLARELHDSVSQSLYGIALGTRTARAHLDRRSDGLAESLDYILSLAGVALSDMRALIFDLRPETLASEGLVSVLAKRATFVRQRQGLPVVVELCDEPDLPLEVKEGLYSIAREALHNSVKHSRAQQVMLRLDRNDRDIVLEIRDDGIGFDLNASFEGHMGLQSMRERVDYLGGRLEIDSAPGRGTHISVHIPSR